MKQIKMDGNSQLTEIKLIRRTLDNNTHVVYEDFKIKKITAWRKSKSKFLHSLLYNILSLGILHLISLFYPRLYIKLYCESCQVKECNYFLVENIYDEVILCQIHKKKANYISYDFSFIGGDNNYIKVDYDKKINNLKYYFEYKSMRYEYVQKYNQIIPIYMDLSKMTNKKIINYFGEGLSSQIIVDNLRERYGRNEYNLNIKSYLLLFLRNQIPTYLLILLIEIFEFIFLTNYINLIFKCIIIAILIIIQLLIIKYNIINKYKDDYTLDGYKRKIKVTRKYLLKEENKDYTLLNNLDLLPGDIIYLKENEFVPCDCIIIEGECFVCQSNLSGNLDIYKRISLKNNNKIFNYNLSNINILYHGMEIIKIFSKNNHRFITALCINTGANTYKANLYSNILYFTTIKKGRNTYYTFIDGRKRIYIFMLISFLFTAGLGYFLFSSFVQIKMTPEFKKRLPLYFIGMLCKSLMTSFFIVKNIIILFNIYWLNKANITCFDPSRLIDSGKINKIIINKTETLCNNNFIIKGYHIFSDKILNFLKEQNKDLNAYLFCYYQNYLKNKYKDSKIKNTKFLLDRRKSTYMMEKDLSTLSQMKIVLFLECLLSCNNIEINNFELFGNNLELQLFNDMKWNIRENENNSNKKIKINVFEEKSYSNYKHYYITKNIIDIFPNNYYNLTVLSKNIVKKSSINGNSYKLRIYKKFIFNQNLCTAAIVHNFLTNELRFMIKGIPEDIINKCDKKTLPNNLNKIISLYRKQGFIVFCCASSLLDISTYKNEDNDDLESYMEDLTFCGLITLENQIKNYVQNSIEEIKKFNIDLLIISGDNEYNCLSTGYNSGIIEDKNIFVLDRDENNNNRIIIKKICSCKINNNDYENNENNYSKLTQKNNYARLRTSVSIDNNSQNKMDQNPINIPKEKNFEIELNLSDLNNKKKIYKNQKKANTKSKNIIKENSEIERILKIPTINEDDKNKENSDNNKKYIHKKVKRTINDNFDNISKNITNKNKYKFANKNLTLMEKYYFDINFIEYDDVKKGIFCISGKLFNFLYKNKERKGAKKFLDEIINKSKIFFNMSSIDKTLLIDYYEENHNNIICTIGQCDSDINSIISSNIGINLKKPNNRNLILSHFYSTKNDIRCIKDIMEKGRLLYENIIMFEFISLMCTIIFNSFIFCSLLRDYDIIVNQLDFLEIEFILLIISSIFGKSNKENINLNNNPKILTIYYIVLCIEIILIKVISLFIFVNLFHLDLTHNLDIINNDYLSCYFIICIEYIISIIFIFDFISFYKENPFENRILMFLMLFYLAYDFILILLCSSNMSYDFFKITVFAYNETFVDSLMDKNKLGLILSLFIDISATFFVCSITKIIFKKYI